MSRIQVRQHKSFRHGRRAQNRGFTLLEMLVAVAIFAIIGVMSTTLLTQMVQFSNATTDRGERLTELQRAMTILQRDIEQLSYRYIRDELGDPVNELQIGGVALIELTRRGWQNPMALRRSQLQRVAYVVEEQTLFRVFWPVLDRAPDTEPISQVLLRGVDGIEFLAVDAAGNEHSFWPLLGELADVEQNPDGRLVAIKVHMAVDPYGELTRLWVVPFASAPETVEDEQGQSA